VDVSVVAVVGLGYVGLPLAVAFGRQGRTVGLDVSQAKVDACLQGHDPCGELTAEQMRAATQLHFTTDPALLREADDVIVAVPTPVDEARVPDFRALIDASRSIGRHLKPGATVIYESTVYPGATEEICIPELEKASGLRWKQDFSVGYSPERINPGDTQHRLENIVKVVSGDTPQTLEHVAALYSRIVEAGVHRAGSIRIAEAAKVIENTQRDLNIALMNELALIFDRMDIDTLEVLQAAGTKWNFLPFRPGLVGGHCIGVDPYYLTHMAERMGYHPQVILAGRSINDAMGAYVAERTVKQLIAAGSAVKGARVSVLGLTFKEDCADLRNSKVFDIVRELASFGVEVTVSDPMADAAQVRQSQGVDPVAWEALPEAEAMILAVAHRAYRGLAPQDLVGRLKPGGLLIDVKSLLDPQAFRAAGFHVWRL
jgi:UDP-N-acetyl-D-glucosamine/UDP-N-acetyl-D-galactosamine dehydrogenase